MARHNYPAVFVRPYSPARSKAKFNVAPRSVGIVIGQTEARLVVAMVENGYAVRRHVGKFSVDFMDELAEFKHLAMLTRLRRIAPTLPRWRVKLEGCEGRTHETHQNDGPSAV